MATHKIKGMYLFRIPVFLIWILFVSTAPAQQTGVVEGRVINGTDPAIIPVGVPLEVVSLSGGMGIIRSAETDAGGRFRIEGLPVDQMLMVRAIYRETNYHKQFMFDNSGRADIEIEVFEATTSMDGIAVEEYQMVFQAEGSHLQMLDTVLINNGTIPAKTFMDPEGNFRFSKAPDILSLPQMRFTAPGASMSVLQSVLESPDGQSYYSLYPLRPGKTSVDVFQIVPYENRNYTYVKRFYYRIPSIQIGVIPMDMELSGAGLTKVQTDPEKNIAVYRSGPFEAGTEVEWVFSGGTPVTAQETSTVTRESGIRSVPNAVARNAMIIGPLLLMGFILMLWYANNRIGDDVPATVASQKKQLLKRRKALLDHVADLDRRHATQSSDRQEYLRQREEGMRMLRRISLFLKNG